jgi:hypothetical protein
MGPAAATTTRGRRSAAPPRWSRAFELTIPVVSAFRLSTRFGVIVKTWSASVVRISSAMAVAVFESVDGGEQRHRAVDRAGHAGRTVRQARGWRF